MYTIKEMKLTIKNSIFAILAFFAVIVIFTVGGRILKPIQTASAVTTDTWTDASSTNNWNTAGNWSLGSVPGAANVAFFSASSTANATINAAVNVAGISIVSGYTGTITQSSGETVTVGASGFSQAAGVFTGDSAGDAITINGPFSLTGGTFTGTSGVLTLAASSTISSPAATFNNNSGTVNFTSTSTPSAVITGSSTFDNLYFGNGSTTLLTVATGTTLTAAGQLFIENDNSGVSLLGGGQINVQGNIESAEAPAYATSTATIVMNGTGTQIVGDPTACGASVWGQTLYTCTTYGFTLLPNLTISKTLGSVTLEGQIIMAGNFTNTNTTIINPATSTIIFGNGISGITNWPTTNNVYTITGTSTFYNIQFGNYYAVNPESAIITIATGTTITAQGYFQVFHPANSTYVQLLGGGQINVLGNILGEDVTAVTFPTSTVPIIMDGTGTQSIGAIGVFGLTHQYVYLPDLTINKSNGTDVYDEGVVLQVGATTTISQGELNIATQTAAMSFIDDGNLVINSGARLSDYAISNSALTLSSVANNGLVFFDGSGLACTSVMPNYVVLNSTTTGKQVPWSGSGTFLLRYVSAQDQGGTATISDLNGTNVSDNGGTWSFPTGPEVQLLQSVTNSGGAGTTQLALPALGFYPRIGDLILVAVSARNQTISAPTDSASNTYTLVASSTFGSSPSYALSLYYARNILTSSTFAVTVNGNGGTTPFLSASAFDYTGVAPSSTFVTDSTSTDGSSPTTALTSLAAIGQTNNELYFGTATFSASTTASAESGWTAESDVVNNSTNQTLYVEDLPTSTVLTTAATWTAATSTDYAAIMGIFQSPFSSGYAASGTLDSATFDTGVASGTQLNSFVWQGSTPCSSGGSPTCSSVDFQFAVSNSSSGPWNFEGPDGTSHSYFCGSASTSIPLVSTNCSGGGTGGYNLFSGYRYFRYQVILFADSSDAYTPTVSSVSVNWSP